MTGHAYSIIKCVEHRGKKFIKIRNPWGEGAFGRIFHYSL